MRRANSPTCEMCSIMDNIQHLFIYGTYQHKKLSQRNKVMM